MVMEDGVLFVHGHGGRNILVHGYGGRNILVHGHSGWNTFDHGLEGRKTHQKHPPRIRAGGVLLG